MADYKDIFSTRKLNNDKKANLAKYGINGDTEVGIVNNQPSHITAWEASLISSFGKAGEEYVADVGVGTKNPYTGMPQFHEKDEAHDSEVDDHIYHGTKEVSDPEGDGDDPTMTVTDWNVELRATDDILANEAYRAELSEKANPYKGELDYTTLTGMSKVQMEDYIVDHFKLSPDKYQYLTPFTTKPQEFMEEQARLDLKDLSFTSGMETSSAIGDIRTASQKGAAQAGFAKGIVDPLETQMKAITRASTTHDMAYQKTQTELAEKIYREQQRQVEGLYEDIAGLTQR